MHVNDEKVYMYKVQVEQPVLVIGQTLFMQRP